MSLLDFLSYGFIQRALIAGSFTAVSCSVLGIFLVLRRLSLIGDGLAHVTFGSVAVGLLLRVYPVYVSLPLVMMSSLGILRLMEKTRIHGDTAIGIFSSIGIASGILLASLSGGFNVDLFSYLFGNILSISGGEVSLSIALSTTVIFVTCVYYNELFAVTFDAESSRVSGINTERINKILVLLTAVTVVLAMRVVGVMLISAFLIVPAATALQIARSFKAAIILSSVVALVSLISGVAISFMFDLPTGATIVITNFILFLAAIAYKKMRR